MRIFSCDHCHNLLYFENSVCLKCNYALGFDPDRLDMLTLVSHQGNGIYEEVVNPGKQYRFCKNFQYGACNWLVPAETGLEFCRACELNRTIPPSSLENLVRWRRIEVSKHRLVYSLLKLGLRLKPKTETTPEGLAFDFLADISPDKKVMTGHADGVITLNIDEADEAESVHNKVELGEKYRTLLGHFRHEIGHYYWDLSIKGKPFVSKFREVFGDESVDYGEALKAYYANGPKPNWEYEYISPYATSHPWEDWAETCAHYLHLMDTIETAFYFGINVSPKKQTGAKEMDAEINCDPYSLEDFSKIFAMWLPLTFALNSLNRSMGHNDFYPFVVPPRVVEKLTLFHNICQNREKLLSKLE